MGKSDSKTNQSKKRRMQEENVSEEKDRGAKCQKNKVSAPADLDDMAIASPKRRLPQQTKDPATTSETLNFSNNSVVRGGAVNLIRNLRNSKAAKSDDPSKLGNEPSGKQGDSAHGVRRNLIDELDAIDAEFERGNEAQLITDELTAPDGIRLTVNRNEEDEFPDEDEDGNDNDSPFNDTDDISMFDYDNASEADTVIGESCHLNDSCTSSAIISFKPEATANTSACDNNHNYDVINFPGKPIAQMTLEELMEANPTLKKMMGKLMEKKNPQRVRASDTRQVQLKERKQVKGNEVVIQSSNQQQTNIKSPSDTTIYAPALKLTSPQQPQGVVANHLQQNTRKPVGIDPNFVNRFLDKARRSRGGDRPLPNTSTAREVQPQLQPCTSRAHQESEVEERAREFNLQTEQHIQSTTIPTGMGMNITRLNNVLPAVIPAPALANSEAGILPQMNSHEMQSHQADNSQPTPLFMMGGDAGVNANNVKNRGITDDEFFHLTCHVEPNLKHKIEHGEFVDLEKLIVKDRFKSQLNIEQRMELVSRGGETFIMPVEQDLKITNVRRWEQAFRIYAAIYSQANPHRAAEIWQYVYVINSAATSYIWENVAS